MIRLGGSLEDEGGIKPRAPTGATHEANIVFSRRTKRGTNERQPRVMDILRLNYTCVFEFRDEYVCLSKFVG